MADVISDKVILELEARTGRYLGNVRQSRTEFDKSMRAMGSSASKMEKDVSASGRRMSANLNYAISAIAVGAAVKSAQQLADTWTQTGNKLAAAGVEVESLRARQAQLVDVANDTRTAYAQTADIYARVTRSTQELNATDYQRLRVTELINKAVKAGGATTAEQISTITQLGQALASGNLQGDELRSIRENSPLIARAIAEEFDTTIGGLKKLGAEGELTSDRVFGAILKAGEQIDSQFAVTNATIGESFTLLQNEATQFLGNFDKAVGVSTGLAEFTTKIAEDFDLMAQAVIVAAAVIGGAITGRMTVPLQQAAVKNAQFVASIMSGKAAFQLEAEAARANARQILYKAQTDRDAARESVVATQQRINNLNQEAVAYRQNIMLAEQQRAAVAGIAAGRSSSGQFVGGADQAQATAARDTATKAAIANRMQLTRVTRELAAAEGQLAAAHMTLSGALQRVSTAQAGMRLAMAAGAVATRVATLAVKGLSVAMGFFGGPIGLLITVVAGALAYFATEAAKAEAAADNLRSTLEEMEQSAEETTGKVEDLSDKQRDGAKASDEAANSARGSADAYDAVAVAAANAAEYVKYLTAAQRQQRLEKLDEQIGDLQRAQTGGNAADVFQTDNEERVANARKRLFEQAGLPGGSARYDRGQLMDRAWRASQAPGATQDLKDAAQDYSNAVAVYNDNAQMLAQAAAAREVVYRSIDDPTLDRPEPNTSNITTAPVGAGEGSSGGRRGRSRREETREELEARREMAELERRAELQRAAGAESLAQFTEDEITRRRLIAELIEQQFSPEDAERQANAYIAELRGAREVADAAERAEDAREKAAEQKEKDDEAALERQEQLRYMAEQDLLLQRELAALANDSERVKELDKMIDRMRRIRDLVEQGGMSEQGAADRVDDDQGRLDSAERQGEIKNMVMDPVKDALLAAFKGEDWQNAFADAIEQKTAEGLVDGLDKIYDYLLKYFMEIFSQSGSGGGGTAGSGGGSGTDWGKIFVEAGKAIFGGGRAGGGMMKPGMVYNFEENGRERIMVGSTARVLPNRVEGGGAAGNGKTEISLAVINATGVPARATVERDDNDNYRVRLEPLIDSGIMSAGKRGVLDKANKTTPAPRRRG